MKSRVWETMVPNELNLCDFDVWLDLREQTPSVMSHTYMRFLFSKRIVCGQLNCFDIVSEATRLDFIVSSTKVRSSLMRYKRIATKESSLSG